MTFQITHVDPSNRAQARSLQSILSAFYAPKPSESPSEIQLKHLHVHSCIESLISAAARNLSRTLTVCAIYNKFSQYGEALTMKRRSEIKRLFTGTIIRQKEMPYYCLCVLIIWKWASMDEMMHTVKQYPLIDRFCILCFFSCLFTFIKEIMGLFFLWFVEFWCLKFNYAV